MPIQETLLTMVKEIDQICRDNDIVYYLSGGSVIGALRHSGFIPWDDDLDILMTRQNWNKFLSACDKDLPANRKLECIELNAEVNNIVRRYVSTNTLNVHRNELIDGYNAGIDIDILILDPLSDDKESQYDYLKNLVLYSDLLCEPYLYLLRWNFKTHYRLWKLLIKMIGRKRVSAYFERKLVECSDKNGRNYIIAWGYGPTIFDKSIFGTPRYVKFEDCALPVPEKAYEFLRILYGYHVMDIPQETERSMHTTILNLDQSYGEFKSKFDRHSKYSKKQMHKIYMRHKLLAIKWAIRENTDNYRTTLIEAYKIKAVMENTIKAENIDVPKLFKTGNYEKLRELFCEYVEKQSSVAYTGGEMMTLLTRRHHPVYIDVSDKLLYYILRVLLYDEALEKAERIIRAREMDKPEELSADLQEIKGFLIQLREAISLYDQKKFSQSLSVISDFKGAYADLTVVSKLKIRLWGLLNIKNEERKRLVATEYKRFPDDGHFIKHYGDMIYKEHGMSEAYKYYGEAYTKTRNGIIWNEIFTILRNEIEWFYTKSQGLLRKGNLDEADELLDVWGIIPNVLQTSLMYQEVYFSCKVKRSETNSELTEIQSELVGLWDKAEDKSVLIDIYESIMMRLGRDTQFSGYEIVLKKSSSYKELNDLYDEMCRVGSHMANNEQFCFLHAVLLCKLGRLKEGFADLRALWRGNSSIEAVNEILADDLRKQILRMGDKLYNKDAREFFINEWRNKYPDTKETVGILIKTEMYGSEYLEQLEILIDNMLNDKNYVRSIAELMRNMH